MEYHSRDAPAKFCTLWHVEEGVSEPCGGERRYGCRCRCRGDGTTGRRRGEEGKEGEEGEKGEEGEEEEEWGCSNLPLASYNNCGCLEVLASNLMATSRISAVLSTEVPR